jgi:hypothetical protein
MLPGFGIRHTGQRRIPLLVYDISENKIIYGISFQNGFLKKGDIIHI